MASAGINLPCPRSLSHWNWICSGWWSTHVHPLAVRVGQRDIQPIQLLEVEEVGKITRLGVGWRGNPLVGEFPKHRPEAQRLISENNDVRTTNTYISFPYNSLRKAVKLKLDQATPLF